MWLMAIKNILQSTIEFTTRCHDGFEASDVFFGVIHESGSNIDEAISADM